MTVEPTALSLLDEEETLPKKMTIKLNSDSPFLTTPQDELVGVIQEGYRVQSVDDFLGIREVTLAKV